MFHDIAALHCFVEWIKAKECADLELDQEPSAASQTVGGTQSERLEPQCRTQCGTQCGTTMCAAAASQDGDSRWLVFDRGKGSTPSNFPATQRLVRWTERVKRRFDSAVAFPGKGRWLGGFGEGQLLEPGGAGGSVYLEEGHCGGICNWFPIRDSYDESIERLIFRKIELSAISGVVSGRFDEFFIVRTILKEEHDIHRTTLANISIILKRPVNLRLHLDWLFPFQLKEVRGEIVNSSLDFDHCLHHLPLYGCRCWKETQEEVGEWMKVAVDVDVRLIHGGIICCHQRKVTVWQRGRKVFLPQASWPMDGSW